MALTYTATAFNTAGTASVGNGSYKDVADAGAANGDLIVGVALGEGYSFSGGTRSITTQSGSTGSWTTYYPTPTLNNDAEVTAGWATCTGTGSVTVRPVVRTTTGSFGWIGSVIVRIPAAEWTGTPTGVAAFQADADGQASVTLAAGTWTVIYVGADYNAGAPGTSNTPAGATNQTTFTDASHYAVAIRTWTGQAAGTRSYGPTGLSGRDYTGVIIAVQEASAGNTGTLSGSLPKLTGSITGTSTNPGTLSAPLPRVTGSITGTSVNPGTLAGSLPALTGSIAGTSRNPGTLSGALPKVTGSITGQATNPGTLTASLPVLTGSIAGTSTNPGTLSGSLPKLTGSIADVAVNVGTLAGVLPKLTGSITGQSVNPGTLSGSLPRLTGLIADQATNHGTLNGVLPSLTGSIVGTSRNPGTLSGSLPRLTGHLDDAPAIPPAEDRTRVVPVSDRERTVPESDRTVLVPVSDRTRTLELSTRTRTIPALGG